MISDAYLPSLDAMSWLIDTVSLYVAAGIGVGLVVWLIGYLMYWVIDLLKGGTVL